MLEPLLTFMHAQVHTYIHSDFAASYYW